MQMTAEEAMTFENCMLRVENAELKLEQAR